MNGYILISRTIVASEIWSKPPMYLKVWIWLLRHAQFQDYKGLKRGQLFTSVKEIQEGCSHYVGYRKETPTKSQICKILKWMEHIDVSDHESDHESNMIETMKATHGIVVTICNFNDYQDPKFYEGNSKETRKKLDGNAKGDNTNEEEETEEYIIDIYSRVIEHLNARCGTNYKPGTKKTRELIQARLNEGFALEDFMTVIDKKADEWTGTEFERYLKPDTLFTNKFEGYLNQKIRKEEKHAKGETNGGVESRTETADRNGDAYEKFFE